MIIIADLTSEEWHLKNMDNKTQCNLPNVLYLKLLIMIESYRELYIIVLFI